MPVRLFALDIDSTLTDSNQHLAPRTVAAAHTARAAGIKLVLATGRRFAYALPIAEALGFADDDILICSTGTVVRQRDGKLLDRSTLPLNVAQEIAHALDEHRDTLVYTFDDWDSRAGGDNIAAQVVPDRELMIEDPTRLRQLIPRWVEFNAAEIAEVKPVERGLQGREPIQAMICGTIAEMERVHSALQAQPLGSKLNILPTVYPERDIAFMDLLPAGTGKGVSLAKLAAEFGIPREDVAAIGDNHNDLDMLRFAGRAFVVANASPGVLDEAELSGWVRTSSHDNCGAAEVLEMVAEEAVVTASAVPGR